MYEMIKILSRFLKGQSGATAIEYGLIAALIAVGIITAVTAVGTQLGGPDGTFQGIADALAGAAGDGGDPEGD
jgi:pilus assembly protein Flp/PilA